MSFLAYIFDAIFLSVVLILLILGIPFILGYAVHFISGKLKKRALNVIKESFYFSVLKWPGTIVHELSHAVAGILFLRQITEIDLYNRDRPDDTLGYVKFKFGPANTFQQIGCLLIGSSPILAGLFLIKFTFEKCFDLPLIPGDATLIAASAPSLSLLQESLSIALNSLLDTLVMLGNPVNLLNPFFYIFIFCTFILSNSMELSEPDIDTLKTGIIPAILFILALNLAINWIFPLGQFLIDNIWIPLFTFYQLIIITGIIMAINGAVLLLIFSISPIRKSKATQLN
ncbi:MAG: hypothetical protein DWQ05_14780 [Calditrichaeota bacterium]|nr:MAG: hypothetical protein DWQ05_14780 [Calditrichota bacterium]